MVCGNKLVLVLSKVKSLLYNSNFTIENFVTRLFEIFI